MGLNGMGFRQHEVASTPSRARVLAVPAVLAVLA
jgi:hypothetical protein